MTNGTGAGMIDWHNGTGTEAQLLARERLPGLDDAGTIQLARFNWHDSTGTIQQARWHRNDGIGTMARARQMS
jgi:hypothetical protein